MTRIFNRPLKGLGAMAYAVLGAPGYLSLAKGGPAVSEAQLESTKSDIGGQVFHYVVQAALNLDSSSVVVPRLSNKPHALSDGSTGTPTDAFQRRVEARDPTSRSYPPEIPYNCHACHLISNPQALDYILRNRPAAHDGRPRSMLGSSPHEDVKNGILLDKIFRTPFDDRKVVLIHTPSCHLTANDLKVPTTSDDSPLFEPDAQRWTWIWLDDDLRRASSRPEVHDAEFDSDAYHTHPHPVLLDYIFGAAVLTKWGFNADALLDPTRGPALATTDPARGASPHTVLDQEASQRRRGLSTSGVPGPAGDGMSVEKAEALMDFLAARSPAGRAYAQAQQEQEAAARSSIEYWVQDTRKASERGAG